jgi:hypothetical protein
MPLYPNPSTLFTQTKDWIARGQDHVLAQHDARIESGQTPLSLLIEDVKADTPKYIRKLKVAVAAAMVAGGSMVFDLNVGGVNLARAEAVQVETNKAETIKSNPLVTFTNSVFEPGGENASMSKGGTPIAIKHALENDQQITPDEVEGIFTEAAQINNGKTNPINLKEVQIKMSIYTNYINNGMIHSEAMVRATVDCHEQHPELFKFKLNSAGGKSIETKSETNSKQIDSEQVKSKDIKVLRETARQCNIELGTRGKFTIVDKSIDKSSNPQINKNNPNNKKSQTGSNKNNSTNPKNPESTRELTYNEKIFRDSAVCHAQHPEYFTGNLDDVKVLREAASNCGIELGGSEYKNKVGTETNQQANVESNNQTKVENQVKTSINEARTAFNNWAVENKEDILNFLELSRMLAIGGVATIAGSMAVKKMYKKYQELEKTLPSNISKAIIQATFWASLNMPSGVDLSNLVMKLKLQQKSPEQEEQNPDTKKSENQTQTNQNPQTAERSQTPTPESNPNSHQKATNPSEQVSNPKELRPSIGQQWSSFIRGFRESVVGAFTLVMDKVNDIRRSVNNHSSNIKTNSQANKARNQAMRQQVLIEQEEQRIKTQKEEQAQQEQARQEEQEQIRQKQEQVKNQSVNEQKSQQSEAKSKMDRFEIPFVPEAEDSPKTETINIPESMREFSNHDLQAALILSADNLEIARKESKYSEQAQKAADFINKELANCNQNYLLYKFKADYSLPDQYTKLGIDFTRGPHRYGIGNRKEKTIHHRAKGEKNSYTSIQVIWERADYTFEHYLNMLKGLKTHFKKNDKMQNALDVLVAYTNDQDKVVQMQSKMRQELVRRGLAPSIENKGGKCEELDMHSHISYFVNAHSTKKSYYSYNRLIDTKVFSDLSYSLLSELSRSVCEKDTLNDKWVKTTNDKINIERVEEILNTLKELVKVHKIPYGDVKYSNRGKSELFDMGTLDHILWFCEQIKRKLKQPADQLEYLPNEYEFDVIPPNSGKDPYLKPFVLDGTSWPQQGISNPLRIEVIDGQRGIKYPTSLMFPEALENEAMKKHYASLFSELRVSREDINSMLNALKNPNGCSEGDTKKLEWFTKILAKPDYAFRPYRKPKSNNSQKPINLVELLQIIGKSEDSETE